MIYFKDWEISHDGSILARQYDHLSRVLLVRGTPQGYDWEMRVRKGDWYEVIPLSPMEGDVGCVLTESIWRCGAGTACSWWERSAPTA